MNYAPSGDLSFALEEDIADGAMWEGDAHAFVEALLNCSVNGGAGFLETKDGRICVHDWQQHGGTLIERQKADAQRKRESRSQTNNSRPQEEYEPSEGCPQDVRGTSAVEIEKEIKHNSPTESAETAPEEPESRPVEISEIPAAMRPTVELFLQKTRRASIKESELIPLRNLERDHYAARIQQEIYTAVDRFRRRGRDPTTLTFDYLYESLRYQSSRKPKPRMSAEEKKRAEREREQNIALERERQEEFEVEVEAFLAARESGGEGYEPFPGGD
jgi:hypothetical protein